MSEGESLRVSNLTMLRLKIFSEQAVDLEQSFASQADLAIFDPQITSSFLITKGVGKLVEDVDAELPLEGVAGKMAFLQLKDDFANKCLVRRRSHCSIDWKFAGFDSGLVFFDLVEILIVDSLQMPE
jgi:hypothetical protein